MMGGGSDSHGQGGMFGGGGLQGSYGTGGGVNAGGKANSGGLGWGGSGQWGQGLGYNQANSLGGMGQQDFKSADEARAFAAYQAQQKQEQENAQARADAQAMIQSGNITSPNAGYNNLGAAANQNVSSSGSMQNSDAGRDFGDRGGIFGSGIGWDGSGTETSQALSKAGLDMLGAFMPGFNLLKSGYSLAQLLGKTTGLFSLGDLGISEYGGGYKNDGISQGLLNGFTGGRGNGGNGMTGNITEKEYLGQIQSGRNPTGTITPPVTNPTNPYTPGGLAPIGSLTGPSTSFIGSRGEASTTDLLSGAQNQGNSNGYSLYSME